MLWFLYNGDYNKAIGPLIIIIILILVFTFGSVILLAIFYKGNGFKDGDEGIYGYFDDDMGDASLFSPETLKTSEDNEKDEEEKKEINMRMNKHLSQGA